MITFDNVKRLAEQCRVILESPSYDKQGVYKMLKNDIVFGLSSKKELRVYCGFEWDENSVPAFPFFLRIAFPKSGIYAVPALIHDALYADNTTSQKYADEEYLKWMKAVGISKFQRICRYKAVRWFGKSYWKKSAKDNESRKYVKIRTLNY